MVHDHVFLVHKEFGVSHKSCICAAGRARVGCAAWALLLGSAFVVATGGVATCMPEPSGVGGQVKTASTFVGGGVLSW